ncbi:MAG: helix-turn-helix domain-containing protein [Planctomycetota bacterium]|nr:helix-turn-helix domain-containing protein [Planctomycetota bacterium]
MPPDLKNVYRVRTPEQLRILAAPMRNAIFEAMCDLAPCTLAALSEHLDKSSESLHYHIKLLEKIGVVKAVGLEESGGRKRVIYDLPSKLLKLDPPRRSKAFQAAKADGASAWLRLMDQQLRKAIEAERELAPSKEKRTIRIEREVVSLSPSDLTRLNALLDQIHVLCGKADVVGKEHRIALTFAMCLVDP